MQGRSDKSESEIPQVTGCGLWRHSRSCSYTLSTGHPIHRHQFPRRSLAGRRVPVCAFLRAERLRHSLQLCLAVPRSALRRGRSSFFTARFARIYPLYLFFFVFGVVSDFTFNWISYAPKEFTNFIVHAATLTRRGSISSHPDRTVLENGFGLSGRCSAEFFFFYVAIAFFVFAILRIRRP